jgi:DNA-binding transcriptional LysR family regulator
MKELRQFVEVASRRSISLAARQLNISQSALSRAVQKLEDSYGAPLFVRTGGGMELSPCGSALYAQVLKILPALDQVREEIEQLQGRTRAAIRIGAGDLWGLAILPDVVRRFAHSHPDVVVHMTIADEAKRLEGLWNGTFDLVFGTLSTRYGVALDVEFEAMTRQGTSVYCDHNHPLATREAVTTEDLLGYRWINPGYDDAADPAPLGREQRDVAVRADTTMNALLLLKRSNFLMSASSGFKQLFRQFGAIELQTGDLRPGTESGAIYPARSGTKAGVAEFLQVARSQLGLQGQL